LVDLEERNLINGMSALPDAEMSAFVQALRPGGEAP
jgi:hypothetical protein